MCPGNMLTAKAGAGLTWRAVLSAARLREYSAAADAAGRTSYCNAATGAPGITAATQPGLRTRNCEPWATSTRRERILFTARNRNSATRTEPGATAGLTAKTFLTMHTVPYTDAAPMRCPPGFANGYAKYWAVQRQRLVHLLANYRPQGQGQHQPSFRSQPPGQRPPNYHQVRDPSETIRCATPGREGCNANSNKEDARWHFIPATNRPSSR